MAKKNLLSWKSKKRKKKEQVPSIFEKVKKYLIKFFIYEKNAYKLFISQLDKDKIKILKKFFLIITGYGFVINYSIYFIFDNLNIKFNLFTLFAWGIAYYFISDEFVEWFRRLIAKR